MNPNAAQKKPDWIVTALSTLLALLVSGLAGLLLTNLVLDWLGKEPLFEMDWGFVLFGMVLLAGESVRSTQLELTDGPEKRNQTITMGLIAIGLYFVTPGLVLKVVFGILGLLSVILAGLVWLAGKKKQT